LREKAEVQPVNLSVHVVARKMPVDVGCTKSSFTVAAFGLELWAVIAHLVEVTS
jgi:hypothetical protein